MRHDPPDSLGVDLRALRKARGLTLTDLAARLGRSVGWLSQVERDLSAPGIDDLRAMAQACGGRWVRRRRGWWRNCFRPI